MSEFHPNRVRPPRPRFTLRRALAFWPGLVWIGVVALAFWAYNKGVKFTRMNGLVDPITEAVAADEDARILEILVKTGTEVKKGDPVVKLDSQILDAQIGKLEAAIRSDLEDRVLQYELDLARLKAERRRTERDFAGDKGELESLERRLEELDNLRKAQPSNFTSQWGLSEVLSEVNKDASRLRATTALYPAQIEEVEKDIGAIQAEINKLKEAFDNPERLAAANGDLADLQELRVLKQRSTLYSGHDGIVDRVERDDGEFILKGDTILRIVANPEVIRVLLLNEQLGQVKVGDTVWVSSVIDRYHYFETQITNTSPRVMNGPNTTSPLPNQVIHGQEIIARYPKESGFVPGQPVIVHVEEPGKVPLITRIFGGRGRAEQ